jgi:hypothetical protein
MHGARIPAKPAGLATGGRSPVGMARRFGHGALSGPGDDLAQAIFESDAWKNGTKDAANRVYDQVLARLQVDRDQLVDEFVASATPKVRAAMQELLNDADTQAAIGRTSQDIEDRFRKGIFQAVAAGVVTTLVGTFLIVRFTKARS